MRDSKRIGKRRRPDRLARALKTHFSPCFDTTGARPDPAGAEFFWSHSGLFVHCKSFSQARAKNTRIKGQIVALVKKPLKTRKNRGIRATLSLKLFAEAQNA
jgi:hypothetical protein